MRLRIPTSAARKQLAEIVNRAHYNGDVTLLTRHGKDFAAVVPTKLIPPEIEAPPKKKPSSRVR